ncbi:hypothetical protein P355_3584 [Burkholderia cenocepacia KC-01]|nr:hypothetical protein P355_3584 [Burkholderia cenocepacia KC-01]
MPAVDAAGRVPAPGGVAFSVSVNRRATVRGSARFIDAM